MSDAFDETVDFGQRSYVTIVRFGEEIIIGIQFVEGVEEGHLVDDESIEIPLTVEQVENLIDALGRAIGRQNIL